MDQIKELLKIPEGYTFRYFSYYTEEYIIEKFVPKEEIYLLGGEVYSFDEHVIDVILTTEGLYHAVVNDYDNAYRLIKVGGVNIDIAIALAPQEKINPKEKNMTEIKTLLQIYSEDTFERFSPEMEEYFINKYIPKDEILLLGGEVSSYGEYVYDAVLTSKGLYHGMVYDDENGYKLIKIGDVTISIKDI